MADYLFCDTCVIIDTINGRSTVLNKLLAKDTHLFINSIIKMELLQGGRYKKELRVIKKKLLSFRLLDLKQIIFDSATQLIRDYGLSHGLALPDAVVGAAL